MCLKCQQKFTQGMHDLFAWWGKVLVRCTCLVFIISLAMTIYGLSLFPNAQKFEDEQLVWTPAGSISLQNKAIQEGMFGEGSSQRVVSFIVYALPTEANPSQNMIRKDVFQEMIDLDAVIYTPKLRKDWLKDANQTEVVGEELGFYELCKQFEFAEDEDEDEENRVIYPPQCQSTGRPIDFVYIKETNSYNLDRFETDTHLLFKLRTGKGDPEIYKRYSLYIENIFGGTYPKDIEQNFFTGENDIVQAKAAIFVYFIDVARQPTLQEDEWYPRFEVLLQEAVEDFNVNVAKTIGVKILTIGGVQDAFKGDIQSDLILIQVAVQLVAIYTMINLGGSSPEHSRVLIAFCGLVTIGTSYIAGNGIAGTLGYEVAGVHNLLSFLLIGIGADDFFVVCNALDQTDIRDPLEKRFAIAYAGAGSSITITSFTNIIAFIVGSTTPLIALSSFCIYAAMSILMLYFSCLTVWSCLLVWDTKRQVKRRGDCCGLCCCPDDGALCCRGKGISPKQRRFSGLVDSDDEDWIEEECRDVPRMKRGCFCTIKEVKNKSDIVAITIQGKDSEKGIIDQLNEPKPFKAKRTRDPNKIEYASSIERFLGESLAPEVLSHEGRITILTGYAILMVISAYGCSKVTVDFGVDFIISPDAYVFGYFELDDIYFRSGFQITSYVDNKELDYTSRETQYQMQEFQTQFYRCNNCQKSWVAENTLSNWYSAFNGFVGMGACSFVRGGYSPQYPNYVQPEFFYPCLWEFIAEDAGSRYENEFVLSGPIGDANTLIQGYRFTANTINIESVANDGPQLLKDIRKIEQEYGLNGTFSYAQNYLDYEQYFTFAADTIEGTILGVVAVTVVIFTITSSVAATLLVMLAVVLVDYFLVAIVYFWGLNFNSVVVVNTVIAIGLSVDYSAHIAHTYLVIIPPKSCKTPDEKRMYKAKTAISQMGAAVFHGGFSTFLAISVLGPSKSYVFEVFFKCWCCIIIFGMANGFLLLPIILSFVGPHENLISDGHETPDDAEEPLKGDETPKEDEIPINDPEKEVGIDSQRSDKPMLNNPLSTPSKDNKDYLDYDRTDNKQRPGSSSDMKLINNSDMRTTAQKPFANSATDGFHFCGKKSNSGKPLSSGTAVNQQINLLNNPSQEIELVASLHDKSEKNNTNRGFNNQHLAKIEENKMPEVCLCHQPNGECVCPIVYEGKAHYMDKLQGMVEMGQDDKRLRNLNQQQKKQQFKAEEILKGGQGKDEFD